MATPNSLAELSRDLAQAVESGSASVVAVHGRPHIPSSGILWTDGVVVTTDHTLKRDEDLTLTLPDGRNLPATLAGRDAGTDIAVLKIEGTGAAAAKTVDHASIKQGNLVLALGRGGENGIRASFGVVSALDGAWRSWRGGQIDRLIAPDVNVFYGFSGGPLIDAEARIVGLNTTGLTRGSGVTVPASTVERVVNDLLTRGRVQRGYLGVGLHPVALPDGRKGLVILSIEANGPADRAGMYIGDILIALEGQPVEDTDDVQSHLSGERVGQAIEATIVRGGSDIKVSVTPGERR